MRKGDTAALVVRREAHCAPKIQLRLDVFANRGACGSENAMGCGWALKRSNQGEGVA